jgi:hypothetical protein
MAEAHILLGWGMILAAFAGIRGGPQRVGDCRRASRAATAILLRPRASFEGL